MKAVDVAKVTEIIRQENCQLPEAGLIFLGQIAAGETDGISCWRSDDVERRAGSAIEGVGLFATDDIPAGRVLAIKQGHVIDAMTVKQNADIIRGTHQQIDNNRFLAGLTPEEVDKNLVGYNHSCDPNARTLLVPYMPIAMIATRRAITSGDEITVDYSASQMSNTHAIFNCHCGSSNCRHIIAPRWDWKDPALQAAYQEELPWFIRDAIGESQTASTKFPEAYNSVERTLALAEGVTLADADLIEKRQVLAELVNEPPHVWLRWLARGIIPRMPGVRRAFKTLESDKLVMLGYFSVMCPLGNIEESGLDRAALQAAIAKDGRDGVEHYMRAQPEARLEELTDFAKSIDLHLGG